MFAIPRAYSGPSCAFEVLGSAFLSTTTCGCGRVVSGSDWPTLGHGLGDSTLLSSLSALVSEQTHAINSEIGKHKTIFVLLSIFSLAVLLPLIGQL
jgi:hypothetical protein